jgi:hypothetical protein
MSKPTRLSKVVLPIEYVTLTKLKDDEGNGVIVGCGAIAESRIVALTRAVPGAAPATVGEDARAADDPAVLEAVALEMLRYAPPIITEGCFLLGEEGEEVRPAFWFDQPIPGALPGRYLSDGDKVALLSALLRVGGYLGGAAEAAAFPGGERAGDGGGDRAGGGGPDAGGERQ